MKTHQTDRAVPLVLHYYYYYCLFCERVRVRTRHRTNAAIPCMIQHTSSALYRRTDRLAGRSAHSLTDSARYIARRASPQPPAGPSTTHRRPRPTAYRSPHPLGTAAALLTLRRTHNERATVPLRSSPIHICCGRHGKSL